MFRSRLRRLRRLVIGFVAVLSMPGLFLAWTAYTQLKWQTFHQYGQLAQSFTQEVDVLLQAFALQEEAHKVADFSFWAGTTRSPLAELPESGDNPLIGYFQINEAGVVSTPLLPPPESDGQPSGLTPSERQRREARFQQITAVLQSNQLVNPRQTKPAEPADSAPARASISNEASLSSVMEDKADAPAAVRDMAGQAVEAEASAPPASSLDLFESYERKQKDTQPLSGKLGRLNGLVLEEVVGGDSKAAIKKKEPISQKREARKEQGVEFSSAPAPMAKAVTPDSPVVRLFENEVEPFQLRLLDSGHWVLFRQVIRDGKRWVQGGLFNGEALLNTYVRRPFNLLEWSRHTRLIVAYQNEVMAAFSGQNPRRDYRLQPSELAGQVLYQSPLSAPFDRFRLVLSVQDLPSPDGASFVVYTLLSFLLILTCGAWLIYRQGKGQIALTQQQQDFVSAVSHELKTPLTSIRMYSEILQAGWADEDKKKTYYTYIQEESERLTRLINNVLQLARFQRRELALELKPVSVGAMMDQIRSRLQSRCDTGGFQLLVEVEKALQDQVLRVDPDAMLQIMINLADNAIKFSSRAERRELVVSVAVDSKRLSISLRDFGPGIPPKELSRIFDLFYRTENELTRETVGTGIGLALVRQLVQAMHGTVQAKNCEPGAVFTLFLPRENTG